jgi:hypothetical protein
MSRKDYSETILKQQYNLHKEYVKSRIESSKILGFKIRLPSIPEDISENIIKFIIHKNGDTTSSWDCKRGDLVSTKEGQQECKCFTSDGPSSFTPTSDWDVIYFLDGKNWLKDKFILYKVNLKKSSEEWKSIKVNKKQTFEDQCKQKRRPRINWKQLYSQISPFCEIVFDGLFQDIFILPSKEE